LFLKPFKSRTGHFFDPTFQLFATALLASRLTLRALQSVYGFSKFSSWDWKKFVVLGLGFSGV